MELSQSTFGNSSATMMRYFGSGVADLIKTFARTLKRFDQILNMSQDDSRIFVEFQ